MFNNKALVYLNYQWQHSLQSSIPITKTCKKGEYDIVIFIGNELSQNSCVTCMLQEGNQWNEDELLFTYRPRAYIFN